MDIELRLALFEDQCCGFSWYLSFIYWKYIDWFTNILYNIAYYLLPVISQLQYHIILLSII